MTKKDALIGYIKASNYRKVIMQSLENKKATPIEMAKETGISLSHVSNILAQLVNKKLVVCLTPELKKGRLYELTKEGKGTLANL